ncbi:hypothetical protein RRF57_003787 [Xylaria bambusicola]|uniref:Uncharacterized protein n=1 Tax=Xylaria bambusicola TaxID=326684 RepID=A0AAN7Z3R5_9PEZI
MAVLPFETLFRVPLLLLSVTSVFLVVTDSFRIFSVQICGSYTRQNFTIIVLLVFFLALFITAAFKPQLRIIRMRFVDFILINFSSSPQQRAYGCIRAQRGLISSGGKPNFAG